MILPEAGGIGLIGVGFMPMCIRAEEDKAGVFGWDEMDRIAKQILEVKKEKPFFVRDTEDDAKDPALRVCQTEKARKKLGTHL